MESYDKENCCMENIEALSGVEYYQLEQEDGNYYRCTGGDPQFLLYLRKPHKYIKIIHKIHAQNGHQRLKLFYADKNNKIFSEEHSHYLGFPDGSQYLTILEFDKKHDFLRIDCGTEGDCFKVDDFIIEVPSWGEVIREGLRQSWYSSRSAVIFFSANIKKIKKLPQYLSQYGIGGTLKRFLNQAVEYSSVNHIDKKNQQVVEPYEIVIKKPLEKKRKKVLHIIENFYTGGSSRLIIDIIEYNGHKYDNKVFTMAYRGKEEFLNADVEIIDINNKDEVLEKIRDYSPDIIHVHIWEGQWYHQVFDVLSEIKGVKIIENINTPLKPIVREFIDKYVFVSHYVLEGFHDVCDKKSMVIYPGSNFEVFTRSLNGEYLAKDTIGMVYRLGYDKLNQNSIDVFIKTVQKRPQTKVLIVGGGPQYEIYLEKVKNAGLLDKFTFTGYVPYVELPGWYEKFTIFVAPVWQESFGQVSPFAMSMGMPVAGYDIGAIDEIIDNRRLLAKSEDSDALSNILVELLDDYDNCIEIGKSNQKRAQKLFGVQKMVDDYFDLYESLL